MKRTFGALLAAIFLAAPSLGAVEVDIETGMAISGAVNAYTATITRDNTVTHEVFKGVDFNGSEVWFTANWNDTIGATVKLNMPSSIGETPTIETLFEDTFVWVKLGDLFRGDMGLVHFTRMRTLNRALDVYGYGFLDTAGNHTDTDKLSYLNLSFYTGPVTIEFAPLNNLANGSLAKVDRTLTGGSQWSDNLSSALRLSGAVGEIVELSSTYRLGYNMKDLFKQGDEALAYAPKIYTLTNTFNLLADLLIIPVGDLTLGYSGQFKYTMKSLQNATGVDKSNVISDFYHGVDLRFEWELLNNLCLATHNKVTYGHFLNDGYETEDSISHKIKGSTVLSTWNALGVLYNLNDNIDLQCVAQFKWLQYDDKDKGAVFKDLGVSLHPSVRYNFNDSMHVKGGICFEMTADNRNNPSAPLMDGLTLKPSIPISFSFTF